MTTKEILDFYSFSKVSENEFQNGDWCVRIEGINFEIFSDPEIDPRYYFGSLDNLEKYLRAINLK